MDTNFWALLRIEPGPFAPELNPANNLTFSERSRKVPCTLLGRFVKTFYGRLFVEGFGRLKNVFIGRFGNVL